MIGLPVYSNVKPSSVTPQQFSSWRRSHGMSISACAKRLGISPSSVVLYESGVRGGKAVAIPLLVCLGMSAISSNLEPYSGEKNDCNTPNTDN